MAPEPQNGEKIIDMETFNQLLEIDDDDDREFSKDLAQQYVSQAANTFDEMDAALKEKDLGTLSSLGHFLKGSSASIGFVRVSASCAAMQNLGNKKNEDATEDLDAESALKKCADLLEVLKVEQDKAEKWLADFYKEKWEQPASA